MHYIQRQEKMRKSRKEECQHENKSYKSTDPTAQGKPDQKPNASEGFGINDKLDLSDNQKYVQRQSDNQGRG